MYHLKNLRKIYARNTKRLVHQQHTKGHQRPSAPIGDCREPTLPEQGGLDS